jgi:hypothetical protein
MPRRPPAPRLAIAPCFGIEIAAEIIGNESLRSLAGHRLIVGASSNFSSRIGSSRTRMPVA